MSRFHVTADGAVTTIAFDDGGMNLLSTAALGELANVIAGVRESRLLVFRSGRPNIFAAGADMAEMARFTALEALDFAERGQRLFDAIEKLPLLTVAFIDGDCFGGALDLTLAFDLRFATVRSRFAHPGARIGIVTGFGGTSRWRKVVGAEAARRLFLDNAVLTAEEARQVGLVDGLGDVPADELLALDPATARLVKELTIHAPRLSQREVHLLATHLAALYARRAV